MEGYRWRRTACWLCAALPSLANADGYPFQNTQEDFIMPALGRDDDVGGPADRYSTKPNIKFTTREDFSAIEMISQAWA